MDSDTVAIGTRGEVGAAPRSGITDGSLHHKNLSDVHSNGGKIRAVVTDRGFRAIYAPTGSMGDPAASRPTLRGEYMTVNDAEVSSSSGADAEDAVVASRTTAADTDSPTSTRRPGWGERRARKRAAAAEAELQARLARARRRAEQVSAATVCSLHDLIPEQRTHGD